MKTPFNKSQAKTQQLTRKEFENRLKAALDLDPDTPVDNVVAGVKGLTSPGPASAQQGPAGSGSGARLNPEPGSASGGPETEASGQERLSQIPRPLLIALPIFALIIAIALFAIFWKPQENGGGGTPTSAATAEVGSGLEIRFNDPSPLSVAPGTSVQLPLTAYADGRPAAGVSLAFEVSPPEAGAVNPTALTDTGGAAVVDFIAGSTAQSVTINARLADNPDVSESYNLTIAAQPGLTVSFKDPAPAEPVRVNEPFQIAFIVNNTGQVVAENVKLTVDTPSGLIISDPIDSSCTQTGNNLLCDFGAINSGGNASKVIRYRAGQALEATFEPESFRVTSNGGSAGIPGVESRIVRIEEPRAAAVSITPDSPDLAADGTLTTTLAIDVQDQWGATFNGPATVELSVEREGAAPIAALPTPIVLPLTFACATTGETTLTQLTGPDSVEQQQELAVNTSLSAIALDQENGRLYVTANVAGAEQSGWVPWVTDTSQRTVSCPVEVNTLPATPPQETAATSPNGFILPGSSQTISEGIGTFVYQAGALPGTIRIVAQLIDGNGQPVGEPGQTAITLLETGSLNGSSHIFRDPGGNLEGTDSANTLLFSMATGTPLELYPPDAATPNARQVALRVWVPASAVTTNESGESTLVALIPAGTTVSVGPDPQATTSAEGNPPPQSFSDAANGLPVKVLEDRVDFKQVRLVGWVLNSSLNTEQ